MPNCAPIVTGSQLEHGQTSFKRTKDDTAQEPTTLHSNKLAGRARFKQELTRN